MQKASAGSKKLFEDKVKKETQEFGYIREIVKNIK